MINDKITLHCGISQRNEASSGAKVELYGYDVGAIIKGKWQSLVISPITYTTMKAAQDAGDLAKASADRAILKRRHKNMAKSPHRRVWQGGDDAS